VNLQQEERSYLYKLYINIYISIYIHEICIRQKNELCDLFVEVEGRE